MKSIKIAALIFLLSCNNSADHPTKKDFTFDGISIFKKDMTFKQTKSLLDSLNQEYKLIPSNDEDLYAFGLPYSCCMEKQIVFLPFYSFGELGIRDLFLIFHENHLAIVTAEILEEHYSFNSMKELRNYFALKHGEGDISTSTYRESKALIEVNKETYINDRKQVIMIFTDSVSIDSIRVYDNKVPINTRFDEIDDAKSRLRKRFEKVAKPIITDPSLKPLKPQGDLRGWTENGNNAVKIRSFSFRMSFPNKLKECCVFIENEQGKQDSIKKKNREKEILDAL